MKVKNIKSIILLIILSIHVYVLKTHGDTKMTTCCCGSCKEGGNQENNSISSNNPDLLQKSKFNLLKKEKDNENPLENINENENQKFLLKNDQFHIDTEENNNNKSESNVLSEINNISDIPNTKTNNEIYPKDITSPIEKNSNETNNTSKNKIINETTNNYNQNSLDKILNTSGNNNNINNTEKDQIKTENNPINTENNNNSQNNSKENSSIQANSSIKPEDISKLIECNKDLIDNQKKIIEQRKHIMEKREKLYDIKLAKEEKLINEQNFINDLNTYIKNGNGLGKDHSDLTSIYNDYKEENNMRGKNEDTPTKLIKNLIEFFNNKNKKVEKLMNTLNSIDRFNKNFNSLNESINNVLKKDYGDNYGEIFKAISETYNDYLSLINELKNINVITKDNKNNIYNYFSKLEICYQAVKKELENINQEIIEIDYEKKPKGNSFENFLIRKEIIINNDVCMFEILKNSKIYLKTDTGTKKDNNLTIKVEENEPCFLFLVKKNGYIKFNIVKREKRNKYSEVINLKQGVMKFDNDLQINFYPQSSIITLKCIIKKNPTEPKKKEETKNLKTGHYKIKSFNNYPKEENKKLKRTHLKHKSTLTNNTFGKTLEVNNYNSQLISKKTTNKIDTTKKENNKTKKKIEKIIRTETLKKKTKKFTNRENNITNINNINKEKANIVQKIKTKNIDNVNKKNVNVNYEKKK